MRHLPSSTAARAADPDMADPDMDPLAEFQVRPLGAAPATSLLLILLTSAFALAQIGPLSLAGGPTLDLAQALAWGFRPLAPWDWSPAVAASAIGYVFVHGVVWHLALNLAALRLFGAEAEAYFPPLLVLGVFLLAGLGGAVGHLLWVGVAEEWARYAWLAQAPLSGASAAVFGLLGLDMGRRAALIGRWPREIRVVGPLGFLMATGGAFLAAEILLAAAFPNISAGAHLGGYLVGVACGWAAARRKLRRSAAPA